MALISAQVPVQSRAAVMRRRPNARLVLPAVCWTGTLWLGASVIKAEYVVAGTQVSFSVSPLIRYKTDEYILAVRDRGLRWKFWDSTQAKLEAPLYRGEYLSPSAVIEVWTTQATLAHQEVPGMEIPVNTVQQEGVDRPAYDMVGTARQNLYQLFCVNPHIEYYSTQSPTFNFHLNSVYGC